jgi:hypothetical protein
MAEPVRFIYLAICIWVSLKAYQLVEKPMIQAGNRMAASRALSFETGR